MMNRAMKRPRYPGARGAFTLVELAVSMLISSVLLVGMASTLRLTTMALPDANRPNQKVMTAGRAFREITEELRTAIYITERTAKAVTFTVADRDNDGQPETVRYAWSGTGGDPLTREYNQGAAGVVVEDVSAFALKYRTRRVSEVYPGPIVESAEKVLSSYDPGFAISSWYLNKNWRIAGQYFKPSLPPGTVSWRVTRAALYISNDGNPSGRNLLELYRPDANLLPAGAPLASKTINEWDLTDEKTWYSYSFGDFPELAAGEALCMSLEYLNGGKTLWYEYSPSGVGGTGHYWTLKDKDGSQPSDWGLPNDRGMRHYVYGKYKSPSADQTATRDFVTTIGIALQSGNDGSSRVETSARMLNTPEVLSAVWELDFKGDPTALDMNGDGTTDWSVRGGDTLDTGNLVNGVWQAAATGSIDLDTEPNNNFVELTTVDARFHATEATGAGAYVWINADFSGGTFIPIVATLDLLNDNTQELRLSVGGPVVITIPELRDDFVSVRLLIDPDLDTVNLKVDGVDRGTFAYPPIVPTSDPRKITLYHWGSKSEWDYIRIRVGGNNP